MLYGAEGWSGKATKMKLRLSRAMSEVKRKENREGKGAETRGTLVYLRKEVPMTGVQ